MIGHSEQSGDIPADALPGGLFKLAMGIDRILGALGRFGAWFGVLIVITVVYDVITRKFGLPRGFGINATQLQESEYWMHTILFSLLIGYAYTRQSHVRIDLIRENLPKKIKYIIEIVGTTLLIMPYCVVAIYFNWDYAHKSYLTGEFSKSVIGLTHIWILKSFLVVLFILLAMAAISQCIKAIYGLMGKLPSKLEHTVIGGEGT